MFAFGVGFRDWAWPNLPSNLDFISFKRTAARRHEANRVRMILPLTPCDCSDSDAETIVV